MITRQPLAEVMEKRGKENLVESADLFDKLADPTVRRFGKIDCGGHGRSQVGVGRVDMKRGSLCQSAKVGDLGEGASHPSGFPQTEDRLPPGRS